MANVNVNNAPPPNLDELDPMGLTTHSRSRSHHSIPNPAEGTVEPTHESHVLHEPKLGESQQHLAPQVGVVGVGGGGGGVVPAAPQSVGVGGGLEGEYGEPTVGERVQENFVLVVTIGLGFAFWLMALISQAVVTAQQSNATIRTAWFALLLQLTLLLLSTLLLFTTYLPPYHIQLSTLASLSIVFGALAVDSNIYAPNTPAQRAVAAAWLVTVLIDLFWVLYFTSPPQSPLVGVVHSVGPSVGQDYSKPQFGPGFAGRFGVEGPGAYSTHRQSRALSAAPHVNVELGSLHNEGGAAGNGGNSNRQSGVQNRLSNIPESQGSMSGVGSGYHRQNAPPPASAPVGTPGGAEESRPRSGWSITNLVSNRRDKGKGPASKSSLSDLGTGTGARQELGGAGGGGGGGGGGTGGVQVSEGGSRPASQRVVARAEAMYTYGASSEDPGELAFKKGEILDVLDRSGKWWEAKRSDGRSGIVPSNYLRVIESF